MPLRSVPIFMRVGDQVEIMIGTARQIRDVPAFLRELADRIERGMTADELEPPAPR